MKTRRAIAILGVLVVFDGTGYADDPLVDPKPSAPPEVHKNTVKIDLPAVPAFDVPPPSANGMHSVRALRLRGKPLLGTDVTVKGVITWVYDCVTANRRPGQSNKDVQKLIDADPTICERRKFYVGDSATTAHERSAWVVDVPRPYNKLEVTRLKKADRNDPLRCEPDDKPPKTVCPPTKVGDEVEITATWALASPHSERNSEGLLVYKWMKNVTQRWQTPGTRPTTTPATVRPTRPLPAVVVGKIVKPARIKIRQSALTKSTHATNQGTKAYGQGQWDSAITHYADAVAAWKDNPQAWYGMGAAYAQKREWGKAADAVKNAVSTEPDVAMYRLHYGWYLYEAAKHLARTAQARKEGKRVEEVDVDWTTVSFEKPLHELHTALHLDGDLWRAHYLVGDIRQRGGWTLEAARSFTKSVSLAAHEAAPWIALIELYRSWDYSDQALAVAVEGTRVVVGPKDGSMLWFEVGMGFDLKLRNDQAIDAFTKALDANPNNYRATFQRGQAYFRKADYANAKRDLEAFMKVADTAVAFHQQTAARILMDIAAKTGKK